MNSQAMSPPVRPGASPAQKLPTSALVGKGFSADVYPWDEGRVLKLLHAWVPHAGAERECRVTRAVHAAGVPVPKAHELVDIQGRVGIVFERGDGLSILRGSCEWGEGSWALAPIRELPSRDGGDTIGLRRPPATGNAGGEQAWISGGTPGTKHTLVVMASRRRRRKQWLVGASRSIVETPSIWLQVEDAGVVGCR